MCHYLCTVCVRVDCERSTYGTHGLSVSKSSVAPGVHYLIIAQYKLAKYKDNGNVKVGAGTRDYTVPLCHDISKLCKVHAHTHTT